MIEEIRIERIARRSLPGELSKLPNNENSVRYEENKEDSDNKGNSPEGDIEETCKVDKLLEELKKNEPTSDNLFFRLSIITYEIGDLHKAIVYGERFKNDKKMKIAHLANGKLALADILTQLYLLCISMGWDFHKLRKLGAEHLEERHKDFKKDKWCEIK